MKKGDKVTYQQEIRFKGTETLTATIVAKVGTFTYLLDNGQSITIIK